MSGKNINNINNEWSVIIDSIKSMRNDISTLKNEIKDEIRKLENKIDILTRQYNKNTIKITELQTKYTERVSNCNNRFTILEEKILEINERNKDFWARITGAIAILISIFNLIFLLIRIVK